MKLTGENLHSAVIDMFFNGYWPVSRIVEELHRQNLKFDEHEARVIFMGLESEIERLELVKCKEPDEPKSMR